MVNTARGPVDAADLGRTLIHEHIAIRTPGIADNWPELADDACLSSAEEKLRALAQRGIGAIVELTTADMGRDARYLQDVAARTSIHIIVCTGIYWVVPRYWWRRDAEELAAVFVKDITEGIQGTDLKAGVIKLASDQAPTDAFGRAIVHQGDAALQEMCLRAGARAHRRTGVPIATHNNPPTLGREQQCIFADEGVDLSRVVIGHVGDTTDTGYLKELMERGSCVGMDRFGLDAILPFEDRVDTVAALCRDGYTDRVVLSHDAACCLDWLPNHQNIGEHLPNWHFNHIPDDVLPALRQRGVSDRQIDQMLINNPRRLFDAQDPY